MYHQNDQMQLKRVLLYDKALPHPKSTVKNVNDYENKHLKK